MNPLPFIGPLSVSRGSVLPADPDAACLDHADTCLIALQDWGWDTCDEIDAFIAFQTPDIDTTLILKPDSLGYVRYEDWDSGDRDTVIREIEDSIKAGLAQQASRLSIPISFDGWAVYPKLDQSRNIMYYATASRWQDDTVINIEATVFDRRGHVQFMIVPMATEMTEIEVEAMIVSALSEYQPKTGENDTSFENDDKVASIGAVGVLAGLAGVKYSTGAAGLLALALVFLKKAWFVLLLPVFFLKNLFSRNRND